MVIKSIYSYFFNILKSLFPCRVSKLSGIVRERELLFHGNHGYNRYMKIHRYPFHSNIILVLRSNLAEEKLAFYEAYEIHRQKLTTYHKHFLMMMMIMKMVMTILMMMMMMMMMIMMMNF